MLSVLQNVNVRRQAEAAGAAAASMAAEAGMTTEQQITAAAVAALTSGQIPPLVVEAWFMQVCGCPVQAALPLVISDTARAHKDDLEDAVSSAAGAAAAAVRALGTSHSI